MSAHKGFWYVENESFIIKSWTFSITWLCSKIMCWTSKLNRWLWHPMYSGPALWTKARLVAAWSLIEAKTIYIVFSKTDRKKLRDSKILSSILLCFNIHWQHCEKNFAISNINLCRKWSRDTCIARVTSRSSIKLNSKLFWKQCFNFLLSPNKKFSYVHHQQMTWDAFSFEVSARNCILLEWKIL